MKSSNTLALGTKLSSYMNTKLFASHHIVSIGFESKDKQDKISPYLILSIEHLSSFTKEIFAVQFLIISGKTPDPCLKALH